jgi:DNA (cytosine-5)-methyltransferase 1
MNEKTTVLLKAKEIIKPTALAHVPQDSDVEAVTDQWLHAIATDSEFYCNPELTGFEELKRRVIRQLEQNGLYTTRSVFFDDVFGFLRLKPTFDAKFRFIDLFAGIGGIRLGFQQNGGTCVFSSEFDKHAQQTYRANHGEIPFGDITRIPAIEIPSHDVLLAGFPCQPFSHAGLKLGIDDTRGTLFHDIAKILETKKPKFALLENVKGLISHDSGFTLRVILRTLTSIGYSCNIPKSVIETGTTQEIQRLAKKMVLKSIDFGVPQNRQRIYIVLWQDGLIEKFEYPESTSVDTKVDDILEKYPDPKLTISDCLWEGHKRRKIQNKKNGKGFGFGLVNADSAYTNTISARYYKDGSEILIEQLGKNPRKVSPREAARLQGFPDEFIYSLSAVQAYKQFGNSVTVAVIDALARKIGEVLNDT